MARLIPLAIVAALALPAAPAQPFFERAGDPFPFEVSGALAHADFDQDGDVDLFSTGEGLFRNDGHGVFTRGWPSSPAVEALPASLAASGESVVECLAGDLDGDGWVDALVVTATLGSIAAGPDAISFRFWRNSGSGVLVEGTVATITTFPPITFAAAVAAALGDLDGDGDLDVACVPIAASGAALPIRTLLNLGNGVFLPGPPGEAAAYGPGIAMEDLDLDGNVDLMVMYPSVAVPPSPSVRVFWGDGTAAFAGAASTWITASNPTRLLVGDLDGDALPEVLVREWTQYLRAVRNLGGRAFGGATTAPIPGFGDMALGDLDGDGDGNAEVVAWEETTAAASVFDIGPGGASTFPLTGLDRSVFAPPLRCFDADGDGDDDLVSGGRYERVRIAISDGAGGLHASSRAIVGTGGLGVLDDVDGDGRRDLLIAGSADLAWARNEGAGRFRRMPPLFAFPEPGSGYGTIVRFDGDGDGDQDVFFSSRPTSLVPMVSLIGERTADGYTLAAPVPQAIGASCAAAADVDGDGRDELVVGRDFASVATIGTPLGDLVLSWAGGAALSTTPLPGAAGYTNQILPDDVDGDGDVDLIVHHLPIVAGGPGMRLLRNDGKGGFSSTEIPLVPLISGVAPRLIDVEGDGDRDLLIFTSTPFANGNPWLTALVYANDGAGGYQPGTAPPATTAWQSPDPGVLDLDGDGDFDLVAITADPAAVVLLNEGAGSFARVETHFMRPYAIPGSLLVEDLDGDARQDLVLVGGKECTVLKRTGHGIAARSHARLGRPLVLDVIGPPSTSFYLLASAGPGAVPLGAAGTLWLDPAGLVLAAAGTLLQGGHAFLDVAVPADPGLVGGRVWWQAWIEGTGRLSNLEVSEVVGW